MNRCFKSFPIISNLVMDFRSQSDLEGTIRQWYKNVFVLFSIPFRELQNWSLMRNRASASQTWLNTEIMQWTSKTLDDKFTLLISWIHMSEGKSQEPLLIFLRTPTSFWWFHCSAKFKDHRLWEMSSSSLRFSEDFYVWDLKTNKLY